MTSARSLAPVRSAALAALLLALLGSPQAEAAPPEIVVAADPTASDALAPDAPAGPVSLVYRVAEIFSGEPAGSSLVVRHDALSDEDRARLRDGERVILLANRDPETPGRYVAGAPLRATPSALSAFRKWSAPDDVRAERPVEDVVREVEHSAPAGLPVIAETEAAHPPVAPPAEPPRLRTEDEVLTARHEREARPAEATKPPEPEREPRPEPEPVRASPAPVTRGAPAEGLHPASGPGLPPAPVRTALGPALEQRDDLSPPPRGRQER